MGDSLNKIMHLYLAMTFPMLMFALFFATGLDDGQVPLSSGAFTQPYHGENSLASLALAGAAAAHFLLYHLFILPLFLKDESTHAAALASAEMTAMFGFVIGFLNLNPWAAMPYFAISLANFAYASLKISQSPGKAA